MKITHLTLIAAFFLSQVQAAVTLPKHVTKSYECGSCTTLSHEELHDNWPITNKNLNTSVNNLQKSYSYEEHVTAKQLYKGVTMSTLAPSALIHITALQNKALPQFSIKTPSAQSLDIKTASLLYSDNKSLDDSLPSSPYQTMLQLKPESGFGRWVIQSNQTNANDSDTYIINVFDKFSPLHLDVQSTAHHYYYGDQVIAQIKLTDDEVNIPIDKIEAWLKGPSGQIIPLKITQEKNNLFEAKATLKSKTNDHGENWYIEVITETGDEEPLIRRNAHTAFSYSIPSAHVIKLKKIAAKPLTFSATIRVETASRYTLQSVLFHKNDSEVMQPLELSQTAQWLEPGIRTLQFTFDNSDQLTDDSLYLGYLRLIDYGQLKPVCQYNHPIKLTQLVE